ncbi:TRADD-N-associated membrane domain-containing protein [Flavicella marina]|uniref:TRADD-N-associated membrane domain-containing protein n=1 Tax=Flavicella marina TaxID=1475951 RepID=UPI001264CE48|nr:hypothetical protein [Flavicella marina]
MDKKIVRIFIIGFIWVTTGIIINLTKNEDGAGIMVLAVGLLIESIALLLFFWKKIKNKQ